MAALPPFFLVRQNHVQMGRRTQSNPDLLRENSHGKWPHFTQIIKQYVHDRLADNEALDLLDSLDWKIQDDKATLYGASKDQIRASFLGWLPRLGRLR
jgi:hypothetical protein